MTFQGNDCIQDPLLPIVGRSGRFAETVSNLWIRQSEGGSSFYLQVCFHNTFYVYASKNNLKVSFILNLRNDAVVVWCLGQVWMTLTNLIFKHKVNVARQKDNVAKLKGPVNIIRLLAHLEIGVKWVISQNELAVSMQRFRIIMK